MKNTLLLSTLKHVTLITLIALFFTWAGCARPEKSGNSSSTGIKMVTIKGSDTMVHLVSNWAEDFMRQYPSIQVSVTGGGSGTGIAALINGTTDIAASSRDIKDKEKKQAEEKGTRLKEVTVGSDGIAIIVNNNNPLNELSMSQIKDIFTGKITNWKQLGGPEQPILSYSRESSSGTYVFFQEHVLDKKDYAKSTRLMPATSGIVEAVSSDASGIGYVGLGYAQKTGDKVKVIAVKSDMKAKAITPSEESVLDKSYPIARELYLYVPEKVSGASDQFVEYVLSKKGQEIVKESGYIPNLEKSE